jgi:transcription elongation factor Elf1
MSELIKAEGIVVSCYFKCPHCGKINIASFTSMPITSVLVNEEVELYYEEPCHTCEKIVKIGVVSISK